MLLPEAHDISVMSPELKRRIDELDGLTEDHCYAQEG